MLAIATNISVLRMTGFVVQGHTHTHIRKTWPECTLNLITLKKAFQKYWFNKNTDEKRKQVLYSGGPWQEIRK